ncbi:MAG: NAD(P)H-dependent oxidoreductase subunit E, partial [bacterium]
MANEQQNDEPRQGPRVVPRLRTMQEAYGYLPRPKLESLATELEIPLHRIHEIVSFFPHYRLKPGPAIHIRVCRDLACDHAGSAVLKQRLEALVAEFGSGKMVVEWTSCLGLCDKAPAVQAEFESLGRHPIAVDDGQDHPEHIVSRMRDLVERFSEGRTDLHDDAGLKPAGRPRWKLNYRNSGELELEEFAALKQFAASLVVAPSPEARLEVLQA